MRLAIADPPYLGRAAMFYGDGKKDFNVGGGIRQTYKADRHDDAHLWDDPETHKGLVDRLIAEYDGWAIAMLPDNLRHYLLWVPEDTRVCVWHDPRVMPTGAHPRRRWEAVLLYRPEGRRRIRDLVWPAVADVLTAPHPAGRPGSSFAGQKPVSWTQWVLSMLGYNPEEDQVDDLFPGSGSVADAIAQGVLA